MMFNMENTAAKEDNSRQLFDLEKDMQDMSHSHVITTNVQDKVQKLNSSLREGSTKETFEKHQTLLAGYLALQKVLGRINRKMI